MIEDFGFIILFLMWAIPVFLFLAYLTVKLTTYARLRAKQLFREEEDQKIPTDKMREEVEKEMARRWREEHGNHQGRV